MQPEIVLLMERMVLALESISHEVKNISLSQSSMKCSLSRLVIDKRPTNVSTQSQTVVSDSGIAFPDTPVESVSPLLRESENRTSVSTIPALCQEERPPVCCAHISELERDPLSFNNNSEAQHNLSSACKKSERVEAETSAEDAENDELAVVCNMTCNPLRPTELTETPEFSSISQRSSQPVEDLSDAASDYNFNEGLNPRITEEVISEENIPNASTQQIKIETRDFNDQQYLSTEAENNHALVSEDRSKMSFTEADGNSSMEITNSAQGNYTLQGGHHYPEPSGCGSSGLQLPGDFLQSLNECTRAVNKDQRPVAFIKQEFLEDEESELRVSREMLERGSGGGRDWVLAAETLNAPSNQFMGSENERFPFRCDVCDKSFSHPVHLENHSWIHVHEKPYSCSICKKRLKNKSSVLFHLRRHSGETPFSCSVCKKSFIRADALTEHKRTHSEEKRFKCRECDKAYKQRGGLVVHMRTHTGQRPFKCIVCGTGFVAKGNLVMHMRTHTGEQPFACNECGRRFSVSSALVRHRRLKHAL